MVMFDVCEVCGIRSFSDLLLTLVTLLLLTSSCSPTKRSAEANPTLAQVTPAIVPSRPATKDSLPQAMELSIAFHPALTSNIGWAKLPEPIPMNRIGNPGVSSIDLTDSYGDWPFEASGQEIANLSVVLNENILCSELFVRIIQRSQPPRLLLAIRGGLRDKGVACLQNLDVPELYLTGCLYRSHRSDEVCDGDAELAALTANDNVRSRIRGLAMSIAQIASLESFASFPKIRYLALLAGQNPDPDLDVGLLPFKKLKELRYLRLVSTAGYPSWSDTALPPELADFLGRLHSLWWPGPFPKLDHCEIRRLRMQSIDDKDLKNIASCTRLGELSSDSSHVTNATPFGQLRELETLSLYHLDASNLAPLGKLTKLRRLNLFAAAAEDFSFLVNLKNLRHLDLSSTRLFSVEHLAPLTQLRTLDLSASQIKSISALAGLHQLTKLDVSTTRTTDISVVAGFGMLATLSLSETDVRDLRALENHASLEWIILRESRVTDVAPLFTMPKLRRVHIGGLRLPKEQLAKLKKRLGFDLDY